MVDRLLVDPADIHQEFDQEAAQRARAKVVDNAIRYFEELQQKSTDSGSPEEVWQQQTGEDMAAFTNRALYTDEGPKVEGSKWGGGAGYWAVHLENCGEGCGYRRGPHPRGHEQGGHGQSRPRGRMAVR